MSPWWTSGAVIVLGVLLAPITTTRDIGALLFGTAGLPNYPTSTRRCRALRDVTMRNIVLILIVSTSCRCPGSHGWFMLPQRPSNTRASPYLWHLLPRLFFLQRAPPTLSPLRAVDNIFIHVMCFLMRVISFILRLLYPCVDSGDM